MENQIAGNVNLDMSSDDDDCIQQVDVKVGGIPYKPQSRVRP